MDDWKKPEFVTEEEPASRTPTSGWAAVRFVLADDEPAGEDENIADNFFVAFDPLW
jgi:hypothetical protein